MWKQTSNNRLKLHRFQPCSGRLALYKHEKMKYYETYTLRDSAGTLDRLTAVLTGVPALIFVFAISPFNWVALLVVMISIVISFSVFKEWLYLFKHFSVLRNRYLIFEACLFLFIATLIKYSEPEMFPVTFTVGIFGSIGLIILYYWFTRSINKYVYKLFYKKQLSEMKKEQEYFSSFSKN